MASPSQTASLSALRERIAHLRGEHAPLLEKILGDRGMSESVRGELVEHLLSEEQEIVEEIRKIAPDLAASLESGRPVRKGAVPEPKAARLTVGSLRDDRVGGRRPSAGLADASVPARTGTRAPAPLTGGRPLQLGSLRRR